MKKITAMIIHNQELPPEKSIDASFGMPSTSLIKFS